MQLRCPSCRSSSSRIHSRYLRILLDLPLSGRAVRLVVLASRFRCGVAACSQRIFTERFGNDVLRPWARRRPCPSSWAGSGRPSGCQLREAAHAGGQQ
ncbi:MAG: transposase family protein [Janthinobacterium lividum]